MQGDRLDGWMTAFYNESQPRPLTGHVFDQYGNPLGGARRAEGPRPRRSPRTEKSREPVDPDAFDWSASTA